MVLSRTAVSLLKHELGLLKARRPPGGSLACSFSTSPCLPQQPDPSGNPEDGRSEETLQENGRLSQRLEQMTEEALEQGGRSAKRALDDAGFSGELKAKLEARILDGKFKSENPAAFAQVKMPSGAGKGTRETAASQPWTGTESLEDAALRMLNDAHKPLRVKQPRKVPQPRSPPVNVELRMKKAVQRSQGERLANARDRTSRYALSQDPNMSVKEREEMRKILAERFSAGARPMPTSVQGLASLANERIEDAIARGQFKNIPRGKGKNVERDHNADSPFIDTTEYLMNKLIQKQDIVPPWIEKQQELVKMAAVFRGRIRKDWKRHAARVIASKGGPLEEQIRRAKLYAEAEADLNPKRPKREALSEIDSEGRLSQLTITETPTSSPEIAEEVKITVSEELATQDPRTVATSSGTMGLQPSASRAEVDSRSSNANDQVQTTGPSAKLFRDPAWLSLEAGYHNLAIQELNNLTRSYNLQAPDLAKKPYFSLERELRSCYADVAPQLADEIRERSRRPEKIRVEVVGHRPGGVLDRFSTDKAKVYDSRKPNYGFKQFWKDLWGGEGEVRA